jgi:hypothetical protein
MTDVKFLTTVFQSGINAKSKEKKMALDKDIDLLFDRFSTTAWKPIQ